MKPRTEYKLEMGEKSKEGRKTHIRNEWDEVQPRWKEKRVTSGQERGPVPNEGRGDYVLGGSYGKFQVVRPTLRGPTRSSAKKGTLIHKKRKKKEVR